MLAGVDADFERMGDVFSTLAAISPFASAPVRITGVAQTHHEESDRPVAVATELRRMGIQVEDDWDSLVIHPGTPRPAEIETYDDHRIAMSFAITGLKAAWDHHSESRLCLQDISGVLRGARGGGRLRLSGITRPRPALDESRFMRTM